jgi:hypothetical protein
MLPAGVLIIGLIAALFFTAPKHLERPVDAAAAKAEAA